MWRPSRPSRQVTYIGMAFAVGLVVAAVAVIAVESRGRSGDDRVATRRYLRAREDFALGSINALSAIRTAMKVFVSDTSVPCRGVLRIISEGSTSVNTPGGVPYNSATQRVNSALLALGEGLDVVARRVEMEASRRFADAVQSLRWSSQRLTRVVHLFGESERSKASLAVPPVCQDIMRWVARGYAGTPVTETQPAARSQLLLAKLGAEVHASGHAAAQPSRAVLRMLAPFEGATERATSSRIERLEGKSERTGLEVWTQSMATVEHALAAPSRSALERSGVHAVPWNR